MYKKGITGPIWKLINQWYAVVRFSEMVTNPTHSPSCKVSTRVASFLLSSTVLLWMTY